MAALLRYNLHYFDDLNADAAESRTDWHYRLIEKWIADNPVGRGSGWEPYPVSLRIVNWIKYAWSGAPLNSQVCTNLATQAAFLEPRLEFHLLGNHLIANAKALAFAGAFFVGSVAEGWFKDGFALFNREVEAQLFEDGGHMELSPMYHAIVLEDVLDMLNLLQMYPSLASPDSWERLSRAAIRMLSWLRILSHPDGGFAFFNDTVFGVAPSFSELNDYATRLGIAIAPFASPRHLPSSGYYRMEFDEGVALLDIGPVAADHLTGHAHADTLSFELSMFGHRVFVNSGVSEYGTSQERQRQRGTAAHNTVVVDGQDSSQVWAGFRVGLRARLTDVKVKESKQDLLVTAAHDGYRRLGCKISHRRTWEKDTSRVLRITDLVSGEGIHSVTSFLHLHPDVQAEMQSNRVLLRLPNGRQLSLFYDCEAETLIEPAVYHPEFSRSISTKRVVSRKTGNLPITMTFRIEW